MAPRREPPSWLAKHATTVGRAADTGALAAGLGWLIVMAGLALLVVVAWLVAAVWRGWPTLVVAALVTVAIGPPWVREFRRRGEVRQAVNRR